MKKYRYVFVVLVFRNVEVLKDFFSTLSIKDYKVIVVNSYYDNKSLEECKMTASQYNADFIPIENKGYGYGNNVGTRYAMEHYKYDFLILSNSDIHILDFVYLDSLNQVSGVIAPQIQMKNGKMQNPNIPWKIKWGYPMVQYAYKHHIYWILTFSHIITRLSRELFFIYSRFIKKDLYEIFCCHGAFIIFTSDIVENLYPFFDDKMFLYNEESYIAFRCEYKAIKTYYCPLIKIEHLEGASSNKDKELLFKNNAQAFNILYNHIINKDFNKE